MDEIVKLVSERTGLSEDKSRVAVETVITHLKSRLPPAMATQLDSFLEGDEAGGNLGNLAGGLGGLLGKK